MNIREFLVGPPLPTQRMAEERMNKIRALAAFSPDALSSIAYANQEIYLGLVVAGAAGLVMSWPIALVIVGLLAILALSYYQTIHAYSNGGGSYTVAKENLGNGIGLIAAAALMIDYILNAAVSLTAGVAAIASAFPALWDYRIVIALGILIIITLANLRGLRESGTAMAIPVYLFLGAYLLMIAYGWIRALMEPAIPFTVTAPPATEQLTLMLILHTFASGCTALTGVEAISNGIPAFKPPESKNAGITMIAMSILMGTLFIGTISLTQHFGVVAGPQETILSALARKLVGSGIPYLVIQVSTLLILSVAANTSFAGFPRLASILAQDGYLPRQFSFLGDRLVFSNGIQVLAGLTAILIILFNGDSHALIPLFAVGVFLAFTLSQAGMVIHWKKEHSKGWWGKALINGFGALATTVTLIVVAYSKFIDGAWIVILLIPLFVTGFYQIKSHYQEVSRELTLKGLPPSLLPLPTPRMVIPVSGIHRGVIEAVRYARGISSRVTAVYVEVSPGAGEKFSQTWAHWEPDIPLVVVPSPYRSVVAPFLEYLEYTDREHNDGQLATVLLPEFIPARWWQMPLHNQTAWMIKLALLYNRRRYNRVRAIIDIPFFLKN